jgi:hypothetical protein
MAQRGNEYLFRLNSVFLRLSSISPPVPVSVTNLSLPAWQNKPHLGGIVFLVPKTETSERG